MYFIYLNTANIGDRQITKVGIAKNSETRLSAFNTGLGYRARGGFCPDVKFVRGMTFKVSDKESAKKIELTYKRINADSLLRGFGSEVFDLTIEESCQKLCGVFHAVS
jgi:hypothetical protein